MEVTEMTERVVNKNVDVGDVDKKKVEEVNKENKDMRINKIDASFGDGYDFLDEACYEVIVETQVEAEEVFKVDVDDFPFISVEIQDDIPEVFKVDLIDDSIFDVVDNKTDNMNDNKTDYKTDNKTGSKIDNMNDNKTDHKTNNKTDNKTNNKTDNKTDNKTNNMTDNKTDNKANYIAYFMVYFELVVALVLCILKKNVVDHDWYRGVRDDCCVLKMFGRLKFFPMGIG